MDPFNKKLYIQLARRLIAEFIINGILLVALSFFFSELAGAISQNLESIVFQASAASFALLLAGVSFIYTTLREDVMEVRAQTSEAAKAGNIEPQREPLLSGLIVPKRQTLTLLRAIFLASFAFIVLLVDNLQWAFPFPMPKLAALAVSGFILYVGNVILFIYYLLRKHIREIYVAEVRLKEAGSSTTPPVAADIRHPVELVKEEIDAVRKQREDLKRRFVLNKVEDFDKEKQALHARIEELQRKLKVALDD